MDEAARVGPREPGREGGEPRPWTSSDPERSEVPQGPEGPGEPGPGLPGPRTLGRGAAAVTVTGKAGAAARCVLCHDDAEAVDLSCAGCGATYHLACAQELPQCATRGCQADPTTGRLPPAPPKTVGTLVFGALAVVVFGLPIALVFRVLVGLGGKLAPGTRDAAQFVGTVVLTLLALLAPIAAIVWAVTRRRDDSAQR